MSAPITRPADPGHILPQVGAGVDGPPATGPRAEPRRGGSGERSEPAWAAVVPAGGRGARLGGADKPGLRLGSRGLLEHLLDGLAPGVPAALVGPPRELVLRVPRPLLLCREDPPGGGPAAAVGAGLSALERAGGAPPVVVVLPADAPFAGLAVPALLAALDGDPGAQAAVAVDGGGRRQVLLVAHRGAALRERVAVLRGPSGAAGAGGLAGLAASRLLPAGGALVEVAVPDVAVADVDAPGDLERLARLAAPLLGRAGGAGLA